MVLKTTNKINLFTDNPLKTINRNETARDLHVDPSCISRILSGKRIPSLVMLKKMADYFGLSLDKMYSLLNIKASGL